MDILEVEVVSKLSTVNPEYKKINLAIPFHQLDSLRLTSYFILLFSKNWSGQEFSQFISKIEKNETYFVVSSPYFLNNSSFYFPVTKSFFNFLEEKLKIEYEKIFQDRKELEDIKYFPILELEKVNDEEFLKKVKEDNKKFKEEVYFRIKNQLSRDNLESKNVYAVETHYINPFRFFVMVDEEYKQKLLTSIFSGSSIHFLGKRISIGFGLVKFNLDTKILEIFKKNLIQIPKEKVEEGYYYLSNRLIITKEVKELVNWEKSYYEIIKISGYLVKEDKLIGRSVFCLKEGSILHIKQNDGLKNSIYKIEKENTGKKYFLPNLPILIKIPYKEVKV